MAQTLIQSSYGRPGNFELLVLTGPNTPKLEHWWRDNSSTGGGRWSTDAVVSSSATASGALIQSTYGTPEHAGNFEALVLEGNKLNHYWRDNTTTTGPWSKTVTVSSSATGAATFIQSTYGTPSYDGNFEALVLEGTNLVHYYRDNTNAQRPWSRTTVVSSKATGPASLIQSNYGTPNSPGNFEAVVLEGSNLVHYYRDNTASGKQTWHSTAVISSKATGPGCLIQSTYSTPGTGNFEVVVPEGNNLVHYWRNNADPKQPWSSGDVVAPIQAKAGCVIQSSYGTPGAPGNLELSVVGSNGNLNKYWRNDGASGNPWSGPITVTTNAEG